MDQAPLAGKVWLEPPFSSVWLSCWYWFLCGGFGSPLGLLSPKGIIYFRSAFTYLSQGS